MTQFYMFKQNAKQSLVFAESVFERLKEFISVEDKPEPLVICTPTQFIVSFEAPEDEVTAEAELEEMEETDEIEAFSSNLKMEVEDQDEDENSGAYFEIETVTEENDINLLEPEFELDLKQTIKQEEPAQPQFDEESTDQIYQCECGVEASSLAELQKHVATHKSIRKSSATCCDVGFRDYKCYAIHQKAHENFNAVASQLPFYSCSICRVMYASEDDLAHHLAKHSSVKEPIDDVLVERRGAFEEHFLRSLTKPLEEPLVDNGDLMSCGHCKKKLSGDDMKIHLLFFHTTSVYCPFDNRQFDGTKQVRLFSDHIRNKHPENFTQNALYSCRHCNQSFTSNFQKLAHMKQCDAKMFACDHCDKRFASDWLLKNHKKQVNGEENGRFSCEMCGKRCVSKSDLQIHNRSHTNERPYSCPICEKRFKTSANRSSHLDIHDTDKKHECDVCGEKFQTRPILRKHKKKHDKQYLQECICRICDKQYISKPHLLRHIKSSHGSPEELTTFGINEFFDEYFESNRE